MLEIILSDYFYSDELEEFIYFKIPRLSITDQKFKHVSTDAKLLYGMLLDRMGLSAKNNWYDDYGRVYIYYTVDEICEDMCCGRDKAMKLLAELDNKKVIGLVERVKQGQGRPTKLYVKRFTTRTAPPKPALLTSRDFLPNSDVNFSNVQRSEKPTSRSRKSRCPEVEKTDPNHTKKNHPDFSHPDPSIPPQSSPREIEIFGVPALFSKNQIPEDDIYPGMSLYELQGRDGQFMGAVLIPVPIPVLADDPRDLKPGDLIMDTGAGYYTPAEFEEKYLSPDYDDGTRAERYGKES